MSVLETASVALGHLECLAMRFGSAEVGFSRKRSGLSHLGAQVNSNDEVEYWGEPGETYDSYLLTRPEAVRVLANRRITLLEG